MPQIPESFPEIPSGAESSVVKDVIEASFQEVVPTDPEWEMLRQSLLGKNGYGESLFRAFEEEAIDYSYGLKTVAIKVFPATDLQDTAPRVSLQSHEGDAIAFNDDLAGVEINLLHHEGRGVLTFMLTDRTGEAEGINGELAVRPDIHTSSSLRLMYKKDPADRKIIGSASMYSEGEMHTYNFVPTSSSQLILLNIAKAILQSPRA